MLHVVAIPGQTPLTPPLRSQAVNDSYRKAFQLVDRNGDGVLSAEELLVFMSNVSLIEVTDMLREVDHDNDNVVSFEEFTNLMELQNQGAEQSIREVWRGLDCNRDGSITIQELRLAMQASDPPLLDPNPNPAALFDPSSPLSSHSLPGLRRAG